MLYFVCVYIFGMMKLSHYCEIREREKIKTKKGKPRRKVMTFHAPSHVRSIFTSEAFYQECICTVIVCTSIFVISFIIFGKADDLHANSSVKLLNNTYKIHPFEFSKKEK